MYEQGMTNTEGRHQESEGGGEGEAGRKEEVGGGSSLTDSDGEAGDGGAQHHVLHQVGAAGPDQRRGLPVRPLVPGRGPHAAEAAGAAVGGAAFSPPGVS